MSSDSIFFCDIIHHKPDFFVHIAGVEFWV